MTKYDYLIVGAGLFGSVFAHEMTKKGKKCLVIDKRNHLGGNVYCENIEGINVHKYGAHIFHTNDKRIWDYVNSFVEFNRYTNSPVANYKGELYNLPFNMNTFYQLWKVKTPEEAKAKIREQVEESGIKKPKNLEEQAISLVGKDIYEKLIKGYTEKQWGRKATELPAFIIKRLPVRFTFDNNYFNDKYQGIPIGGYNKLIEGLLDGIETKTEVDFFEEQEYYEGIADKVVFTGKIDEYFEYQFGKLAYRSLEFEHQTLEMPNYQGNAVVNYTEAEVPYTRILEHKHFEFGKQPKTIVTKEYSKEWEEGSEPYYPVNDDTNSTIYLKYKKLADQKTNIIFGGRLAEYKYYDMHQVIASALTAVKKRNGNYMIDLKGKSLLITGGTGSLGKALTAHILGKYPEIKKLVIFSRDEQKQFQMAQEFPSQKYPQIRFFIGDVRDKDRLIRAFQHIDYVIHAAAMKHVHIAEYNPDECIKTNIGGAENVVEASLQSNVERVVALSTDKACAPINLYGATKLTSDKLFIAANNIKGEKALRFSVVRYGNVMGSNGSVIPFFIKKKKEENKLPITDAEMTRFNISLQGGVEMVMHALEHAWGGELFVPKIPSYKLMDVAEAIGPNCEKPIVGIRPGEKVHEEMITPSDSYNTYDLGKYYAILPNDPMWNLNEFIKTFNATKVPKGFSYNSGTNSDWETVESLRELIKTHVDSNFSV